jgi:hypothetical protein
MEDAQQTRLRNAREDVQFLQRRVGLHLQGLQDQQASLKAFYDLRIGHCPSPNVRQSRN